MMVEAQTMSERYGFRFFRDEGIRACFEQKAVAPASVNVPPSVTSFQK